MLKLKIQLVPEQAGYQGHLLQPVEAAEFVLVVAEMYG
jgi:hypothetical protein